MKNFWVLFVLSAVICAIVILGLLCLPTARQTPILTETPTISSTPTITLTPTPTITLTPTANPTTQNDSSAVTCANANDYLSRGEIDLAMQFYAAIATATPASKCALEGLYLVSLLQSEKKAPESSSTPGATDTPTATPNAGTVVPALVSINAYQDASTQLKTGIQAEPENKGLKTLADQKWFRFERAKNWLSQYFVPVLSFFLIIFLGFMIATTIREWNKLRLDIEEFTCGTAPFSEGDKPSPAKLILSTIEQKLAGLGQSAPLSYPKLVDKSIDPPVFPATLSESFSGVWDFITKFIHPNILTAEGFIEQHTKKGAGLSFKLVSNQINEPMKSFILWHQDINPYGTLELTDQYLLLAKVAAILIYWETVKRNTRFTIWNRLGNLFKKREWKETREKIAEVNFYKAFGTKDVHSYIDAYVASQRLGDNDSKEKLLRRALGKDQDNRFAILNLGTLLLYKKQVNLHKEGKRFLDKINGDKTPKDPFYISANYTLAAWDIEDLVEQKAGKIKEEPLKRAEICLYEALSAAEAFKKEDPVTITDDYITMINIPYLDVRRWLDEISDDFLDHEIEEIGKKDPSSYYVLYNLACHYSMMTWFKKGKGIAEPVDGDLDKAVDYLRDVLYAKPDLVEQMKKDSSLKTLLELRKKSFDALKKQFSPTQQGVQTSLSDLIGQENAQRLQKSGITTPEILLRDAARQTDRVRLAQKCSFNPILLLHWTRVVELIRISGIEIDHIILLDAAGVSSLDDLRNSKKQKLMKDLHAAKKGLDLPTKLPDEKTLTWWITQAQQTISQVEP